MRTTFVLTAALALSATAAAADRPVKRIIPAGEDGQRSYYTVTCKDVRPATLIVEHDSEQVCALPYGAPRRCQSTWSIEQAAANACSSARRD